MALSDPAAAAPVQHLRGFEYRNVCVSFVKCECVCACVCALM
jgi:hypothetical protein